MPLVHREAPPGTIVIAIDDPRHPGTEVEQIFPLAADSPTCRSMSPTSGPSRPSK